MERAEEGEGCAIGLVAEAGVGKQGKDYGGGALMAPITTPVREYFGMRERIVR